jgi:hypothetical protein
LRAVRYELDGGAAIDRVMPLSTASVPRASAHFSTNVPEGWEGRTDLYLAQCERARSILCNVTGRQPKERLTLTWRAANKAQGWTSGIIMVLGGLHDEKGLYDYPWALMHELLHAFGYPHGREMSLCHRPATERLRAFQWYVVDHPEYVP